MTSETHPAEGAVISSPAWALVHPSDPRHGEWMAKIGSDAVPIADRRLEVARGFDGRPTVTARVDPARLDDGQKGRVAAGFAAKSGRSVSEALADLDGGRLRIDAFAMLICDEPETGRMNLDEIARRFDIPLAKGGPPG